MSKLCCRYLQQNKFDIHNQTKLFFNVWNMFYGIGQAENLRHGLIYLLTINETSKMICDKNMDTQY